ncbi:uncharacterized protein [Parasteatoda tepidariorum]|uniref:uncharacterized protein n=1 Tax=Parasteatoda tepidariorum TaxID=114398 RepID=UPI001C71E73F|nr:uncharacterized protein LOC107451902 [Parasteatoda tepidariorum]
MGKKKRLQNTTTRKDNQTDHDKSVKNIDESLSVGNIPETHGSSSEIPSTSFHENSKETVEEEKSESIFHVKGDTQAPPDFSILFKQFKSLGVSKRDKKRQAESAYQLESYDYEEKDMPSYDSETSDDYDSDYENSFDEGVRPNDCLDYVDKTEDQNTIELYSDDRTEFIIIKNKQGKMYYSGELQLNIFDSSSKLSFGSIGNENLLQVDSVDHDQFFGGMNIVEGDELTLDNSFDFNKGLFLERATITCCIYDLLLYRRNIARKRFLKLLNDSYKNISKDLVCAEDFYQLLLLEKSHNLSFENPETLLTEITQHELLSSKIKLQAGNLIEAERKLCNRNQLFPKFRDSSDVNMPDLFRSLQKICKTGIERHRQNLLAKCPNTNFNLVCLIKTINHLPRSKLLYIQENDISLFTELIELTSEKSNLGNKMFPVTFVENVWNKFYKKIEESNRISLKLFIPITNGIYYFLLKSFRCVIEEIVVCKKQTSASELIFFKEGELSIVDAISWSSSKLYHESLEKQYQLIFNLVKHFEPGFYTSENKFSYTFKLLKEKDISTPGNEIRFTCISEERLTWLYIVDCALAPILCDKSNARFKKLSSSVLAGFVNFIQVTEQDRQESFRVATQNIIKFISQTYPYFSATSSTLTDIDSSILTRQIGVIKGVLRSDDDDSLLHHFSNLLDIYNEYWKHRRSIVGKLPIPCSIFKSDVESVMKKLLEIVHKACLREFGEIFMIKFLRMYNEFLKHLKGINFTWFIPKISYFKELDGIVEEVTRGNITAYKIKEPERFIEKLEKKQGEPPKHFVIETIKKLLDIIILLFNKADWSDEDCVKSVGDLLLAIGHSFTHFEDQTDYTDLEHFVRDCTLPFQCVVENCKDYSDFKKSLDSVENFYLNSRKQNQIGIQQALKFCEREVSRAAGKNEFKIKMNRNILEACYNRYTKKMASLENLEIAEILKELKKELGKMQKLPFQKWTPKFKQNVLPVLLAYLASVWSFQESKDVAIIKKRIEPHCVQILCILRLLGVDHEATGVPKHFAQVLTGQGKSLILGLSSALIALTGNEAFVVCYSELLAKRDEKDFDTFFSIFSQFDLKSKISYNTFDDMAQKTLTRKDNGIERSLNSITNDFVLNNLNYKVVDNNNDFKRTVLLIDEADVFFSKDFYGNTYNPVVFLEMKELLEIQPKIWKIVESGITERDTVVRKIREFINERIKCEKYGEFGTFLKSTTDLFENNLKEMVDDAISVSKSSANKVIDETYKINKDGFISYRDSSLIYHTNIFVRYKNVFNYFRLKKNNYEHKNYSNYGYLSVKMGSISYANLPSSYENILGVSGTLMTLNESERNAMIKYGIQTMSAMPSFYGERKLIFEPSKDVYILDTQDSWLSFVFDAVKNVHHNRAVLVFVETDIEMQLFAEKCKNNINRLHTLTGNEDSETFEWRVNEAGIAHTVTLATKTMGRGIDYKSNDRSVEEKGGIHVIQTFFSLDEKEEIQIKGRTARKDNNGTYQLILCKEHLKSLNCSDTDAGKPINTYAELCDARKKIASDNGNAVEERIERSGKKHKMTMEYFESLANYTPEKRSAILSKYPFVEHN